ncbi:MAG: winged helix-turn-helix domain-containing protein [Pseudomonadota bacterium]
MRSPMTVINFRSASSPSDPYENGAQIGRWAVYPQYNQVCADGEVLQLEPKLIELLMVFARRAGETLGRDELMSLVWDGVIVSDGTITNAVAVLRRTLKDDARSPKFIVTVPKRGYRLIAPVSPLKNAPSPTDQVSYFSDTGSDNTPTERGTALPVRIWIGVFGAITLLIGGLQLSRSKPGPLASTQHTLIQRLTSADGREITPTINTDGQLVIFSYQGNSEEDFDLYKLNRDEGIVRLLLEAKDGHEVYPSISPNGESLAFAQLKPNACHVFVTSLQSPAAEEPVFSCATGAPQISWLTEEKLLYFAAGDAPLDFDLVSHDLRSGRRTTIQNGGGKRTPFGFSIDPQGSRVAVLSTLNWTQTEVLLISDIEQPTSVELLATFDGLVTDAFFDSDALWLRTSPGGRHYSRLDLIKNSVTDRLETLDNLNHGVASEDALLFSQVRLDADIKAVGILGDERRDTIIASSGADWHPTTSPDGAHTAFLSDRSGQTEIWVVSGEAPPRQISSFKGGLEVLRFEWSPKSNGFIFADTSGRLWVLPLDRSGRQERTPSGHVVKNPNYGHNQNEIYFSSNASGDWEIWRLDITNNSVFQITTNGGLFARASTDGQSLLYTKYRQDGIWVQQLEGSSPEERLIDELAATNLQQWHIRGDHLYYSRYDGGTYPVFRWNLRSGGEEEVLASTTPYIFSFDVSHDEETIYHSFVEYHGSDLVLVTRP